MANEAKSNLGNILILTGVVVSFGVMFFGGFFFRDLLAKEQISRLQPTPTGAPSKTQAANKDYLPYDLYFDDSLIMVEVAEPHEAIVVSSSRSKSVRKTAQTSRMSFYDGQKWDRKIAYAASGNAGITSDSIVKRWDIYIDSTRVLKQSSQGELQFGDKNITFSTGELQNELAVRSLPGYTKFMSAGKGTFTIDGTSKEAYVLYERIYSLNDKEIQFYNRPLAVTTYWMAFWDEDGTFYHLDSTNVGRPTDVYQSHQFGLEKTTLGSVTKTFDLTPSRDDEKKPTTFTFNLKQPVGVTIKTDVVSSLDKAASQNEIWRMNSVTGTVTKGSKTVKGIGLVEYIRDY